MKEKYIQKTVILFAKWLDAWSGLNLQFVHDKHRPNRQFIDSILYLNTFTSEVYGYRYCTTLLIHELFHHCVQGIHYPEVYKNLRSEFSETHGFRMDIEADLLTFIFLHKKKGWKLNDFYSALFDGRFCFKNESHKWYHFPRLIGSMLTIVNYYFTDKKTIIEPSLSTSHLDGRINYLIYDSGVSKYKSTILSDDQYFFRLKNFYKGDFINFDLYYDELLNIAFHLLSKLGFNDNFLPRI